MATTDTELLDWLQEQLNKALIAECDGLIQAIARLGRCIISAHPAQVGHHLIGRGHMFFRHDLRNIAPLTNFNHTKQWCAPHVSPGAFEIVMKDRRPNQWAWAQASKNEYHKNPDREALLATRERLRAFLAAGKPYRWTKEIQNGNTNI